MNLSDIPYPQRLVVEMMHYATWSCPLTQDMPCGEILAKLRYFFTSEQLDDAREYLTGEQSGI